MMTLHALVLFVHGALRWVVLGLLVAVVARSAMALVRGHVWQASHGRVHRAAVGVLNIQFLLGVALYLVLSPLPRAFLAAPAAGMKDGTLRFFAIEHLFGMVIAIGLVHAGSARVRKASDDRRRHRAALGFTLAGLLIVLLTIPWPGRKYARPLLRTDLGVGSDAPRADREPGVALDGGVGADAHGCTPVYADRCASCHGASGRGDGVLASSLQPRPRDFASSSWARDRSDAEIGAVIREGGPAHGLAATMPPHGDLTDDELGALVRCVRRLGE